MLLLLPRRIDLPLACSLALCLPLMAACKREPIANQQPRQRGVGPDVPAADESAAKLPTRMEPPLAEIRSNDPPPGTTPAAEAAPDQPEQPEQPPRNLQNELETMIGSPASCLGERPANEAPDKLNISLSANVMPSGAVGRGEVSAAGLTPAEVACVRSRLESLHFAQPIENAPITVRGSITLSPRIAKPVAPPTPDGGGTP